MKYILIISLGVILVFCNSKKSKSPQEKREHGFRTDTLDENKRFSSYKTQSGNFRIIVPLVNGRNANAHYEGAARTTYALDIPSIENGFDSLIIRIWYPQLVNTKIVSIEKSSNGWQAVVYNLKFSYNYEIKKTIINSSKNFTHPMNGWENYIKKLKSLKISSLPNFEDIKGYPSFGADGETYSVEVSDKFHYRFYTYPSLEENLDFPDAKNLYEFIKLTNNEFNLK